MITVEKKKNEYGSFDITLKNDSTTLEIIKMGSDIRLSCQSVKCTRVSTLSFFIPEEEMILYPIFERLYQNIIDGNVVNGNMAQSDTQKLAQAIRRYPWYKEVVGEGGIINITCDDYRPECADKLRIWKEEGKIILEFTRVNATFTIKNPFAIPIDIRLEQSHAHELAIPFNNVLFRMLQSIAPTNDNAEKRLVNLPAKRQVIENK